MLCLGVTDPVMSENCGTYLCYFIQKVVVSLFTLTGQTTVSLCVLTLCVDLLCVKFRPLNLRRKPVSLAISKIALCLQAWFGIEAF